MRTVPQLLGAVASPPRPTLTSPRGYTGCAREADPHVHCMHGPARRGLPAISAALLSLFSCWCVETLQHALPARGNTPANRAPRPRRGRHEPSCMRLDREARVSAVVAGVAVRGPRRPAAPERAYCPVAGVARTACGQRFAPWIRVFSRPCWRGQNTQPVEGCNANAGVLC